MTEIKAEGNILNTKKYPPILDNTINFVLLLHDEKQENEYVKKMNIVFCNDELKRFNIFKIKHSLNGYFLVFQINL